ncbi:MAG: DMT family transporter [Beijerinckiaceae bacterium]
MTEAKPGAGDRAFLISHLLANSLTWGSSFLLIKLLGDTLTPVAIASLRAVGAALALGLALLLIRQSIWPKGREARDWLVLGTVNGWAPNVLVAFALSRMDSGPAALIQAAGPLMTAVLAHWFLAGERLTSTRVIGIALGIAGIALLIGPDALSGAATFAAVAAMLLLTLGYSVGNIYARTVPAANPIRLAFGQQIMSAIIATLLVLAWTGADGFRPAAEHMPTLLALSLICTAFPIWIFMRLLTRVGPTRASMTSYLVPAVAVILGVVVLGEPVSTRQIFGGGLVLLSVALVTGLLRLPRNLAP